MALGCGAKVLKYCIFAFNLIFFIAGVVCLSIGIWLIVDNMALDRLANASEHIASSAAFKEFASKPQAVHDIGIILTAGGSVIFIIAFLGCCGAMKEWRPLLVLYAICLMIILAVEIAAAIYAGVNRTNLEASTKMLMHESVKDYNGTTSSANGVRAAWDSIMNQYECCGIESRPGEFNVSSWYKAFRPPEPFPAPCCKNPVPWNPDTYCRASQRYQHGCYDALREVIESKLVIVISVGAAVALIQVRNRRQALLNENHLNYYA
ncbi:tetraspanin family protein [Trichuris trichiura]|uniref:Tetraspanin n=1 Tax=Trichuris trichiura TaxID=36087 RepID=A0A077ZLZ4_TRITR|nr:tetraspanin family protein [Trichuris trichiura]